MLFGSILVDGLDDVHSNNMVKNLFNFLLLHLRLGNDPVQKFLAHCQAIGINIKLISFVLALEKKLLELILRANRKVRMLRTMRHRYPFVIQNSPQFLCLARAKNGIAPRHLYIAEGGSNTVREICIIQRFEWV